MSIPDSLILWDSCTALCTHDCISLCDFAGYIRVLASPCPLRPYLSDTIDIQIAQRPKTTLHVWENRVWRWKRMVLLLAFLSQSRSYFQFGDGGKGMGWRESETKRLKERGSSGVYVCFTAEWSWMEGNLVLVKCWGLSAYVNGRKRESVEWDRQMVRRKDIFFYHGWAVSILRAGATLIHRGECAPLSIPGRERGATVIGCYFSPVCVCVLGWTQLDPVTKSNIEELLYFVSVHVSLCRCVQARMCPIFTKSMLGTLTWLHL